MTIFSPLQPCFPCFFVCFLWCLVRVLLWWWVFFLCFLCFLWTLFFFPFFSFPFPILPLLDWGSVPLWCPCLWEVFVCLWNFFNLKALCLLWWPPDFLASSLNLWSDPCSLCFLLWVTLLELFWISAPPFPCVSKVSKVRASRVARSQKAECMTADLAHIQECSQVDYSLRVPHLKNLSFEIHIHLIHIFCIFCVKTRSSKMNVAPWLR